MKAALVESDKTVSVKEIEAPSLPEGGAIVRVLGCGLCGSDLDKFYNRQVEPGTVLGHEVVGILETLSDKAKEDFKHLKEGQRIAVAHHVPSLTSYYSSHGSPSMCRTFKQTNITPGGFSEKVAITYEHLRHTVFPIPDEISNEAASCIEPFACCLRAIDRVPTGIGKNVFIIGLGFIGLITSQYLTRRAGYNTFGIDLLPQRVELGLNHQMIMSASHKEEDILGELMQATEDRGADLVFMTVVNPKTVELAFRAVRDGGTVLLFTSYDKNEPLLNQNVMYFREINVITSYSPSIQHLQKAHYAIIRNELNLDPLITHRYPLHELQQAMEAYKSGEAIKVYIEL